MPKECAPIEPIKIIVRKFIQHLRRPREQTILWINPAGCREKNAAVRSDASGAADPLPTSRHENSKSKAPSWRTWTRTVMQMSRAGEITCVDRSVALVPDAPTGASRWHSRYHLSNTGQTLRDMSRRFPRNATVRPHTGVTRSELDPSDESDYVTDVANFTQSRAMQENSRTARDTRIRIGTCINSDRVMYE